MDFHSALSVASQAMISAPVFTVAKYGQENRDAARAAARQSQVDWIDDAAKGALAAALDAGERDPLALFNACLEAGTRLFGRGDFSELSIAQRTFVGVLCDAYHGGRT